MTAYRKAARLAYRRMQALTPEKMTTSERLDEEYFVNRFIGKLADLIPTAERIYQSFAYEVDLSFIPLPALLAEEIQDADNIAQERYLERQRKQLAYETEAAEARKMSEMKRDILDKAAAQKEELIGGFIYDILGQLRTLVYEVSTYVLSSIKRNGNLQPRSVVQLKNLIDQLGNLNFLWHVLEYI